MRSVVLDIEHRLLEERDVPEPGLKHQDDVLFRVHEVGVCGTDREMVSFRLRRPPEDVPHLVIGHEALGQVIETGSAVSGLEPGDWVVPMIRRPCAARCRSCARGRPDLCLTNRYTERGLFGADGYFTEKAVDAAGYLTRVPERLIAYAVLMEPLSVVEKAIGRAIAIRQTDEDRALVLGSGPIGMLSAFVLQARGYRVQVFSLEPTGHPRAELLAACGIGYSTSMDGPADIIVEAAGSSDLALAAVRLLGPAGIFVTLGAGQATGDLSFLDLIVGNQTIMGSVNASPESFAAALADLDRLPASALTAMIRRFDFGDYRRSLFGRPGPEPKFVHVIS
jgi:threonine dehydrogenase-like Zn-dependent dehydrogenase